jgi:hypothetical protein
MRGRRIFSAAAALITSGRNLPLVMSGHPSVATMVEKLPDHTLLWQNLFTGTELVIPREEFITPEHFSAMTEFELFPPHVVEDGRVKGSLIIDTSSYN